jgi:protein tyrosine/serine phosphatase
MKFCNTLAALASLVVALSSLQAQANGASRPIDRFLEISPGLYRGGRPAIAEGMDQLATLGVKTILDFEDSSGAIRDEQAASEQRGIKFYSFEMNAFKTPDDNAVDQALDIMADPEAQPVFVHCKEGRDRTGLMVGLYRVLKEGWDPAKAWQEMRDDGFRKLFFPLKHYFEKRTGYEVSAFPFLLDSFARADATSAGI